MTLALFDMAEMALRTLSEVSQEWPTSFSGRDAEALSGWSGRNQ